MKNETIDIQNENIDGSDFSHHCLKTFHIFSPFLHIHKATIPTLFPFRNKLTVRLVTYNIILQNKSRVNIYNNKSKLKVSWICKNTHFACSIFNGFDGKLTLNRFRLMATLQYTYTWYQPRFLLLSSLAAITMRFLSEQTTLLWNNSQASLEFSQKENAPHLPLRLFFHPLACILQST